MGSFLEWYLEVPVVTRFYMTSSVLTTAACSLELLSPFSLYFNFHLVFMKLQLWRLLTNFFFFGSLGVDFLFHMFFLVRYCRLLEEGEFRGRTLDFVVMLGFGAGVMLLFAPLLSVHFLGSSLAFMMVYVWGRRNDAVRMSFLGLFPFTAPYLPWVLLAFSVLLGNPATTDLVGIAVVSALGHFGNGLGMIPFGWDQLLIVILAIGSFRYALVCKLSQDKFDRYMEEEKIFERAEYDAADIKT